MCQLLSKDPVANVRMNVARTIKSCVGRFKDKGVEDNAKKLIAILSDDSDNDVKLGSRAP